MLKNICAGRVFQNAMVSRKLRRKRKLRQNPGLTILNKNIHSTQLGSSMVDYLPVNLEIRGSILVQDNMTYQV